MTPAAAPTGTYVVCVKCGREFPYDWELMQVIRNVKKYKKLIPQPAENA